MIRRAAPVVFGLLAACSRLVGAEFDGLSSRSADAGPSSTAETVPAPTDGRTSFDRDPQDASPLPPVPPPSAPDPTGACPTNTKRCGELCVSPLDPKYGCGAACGVECARPVNGDAVCRDGACAIQCTSGFGECTKGACERLGTFFEDRDGDGFGGNISQQACAAPPGYVARTGDCHDANADVKPSVTSYHVVPYRTPTNGESFDYDCSGAETLETAAHSDYDVCDPVARPGSNCSITDRACFYPPVKRPPAPGLEERCGARVLFCPGSPSNAFRPMDPALDYTGACR